MAAFAVFRADEWTSVCDQEAARWLRAGYHPDQLDPATGVPLEGAVEQADADADPSVAESLLRSSDEVLERARRRSLIRCGVTVAAAVVVGLVAIWVWAL